MNRETYRMCWLASRDPDLVKHMKALGYDPSWQRRAWARWLNEGVEDTPASAEGDAEALEAITRLFSAPPEDGLTP